MAELPVEHFGNLVELHFLLNQVLPNQVVFRSPVNEGYVFLVAGPRLEGPQDQLSLVELPKAKVDAVTSNELTVFFLGEVFSRFHILVFKNLKFFQFRRIYSSLQKLRIIFSEVVLFKLDCPHTFHVPEFSDGVVLASDVLGDRTGHVGEAVFHDFDHCPRRTCVGVYFLNLQHRAF